MSRDGRPATVDGTRYRSHLECRWALVFIGLGLPFVYEPTRFDLPSGVYVPDFLMFPDKDGVEFWIEVKGPMPDSREFHVASEINVHVGQPLLILSGDLPRRTNGGTAWWFEPERRCWIMRSPEEALIDTMFRSVPTEDRPVSLEWQPIIDAARRARWDAEGNMIEEVSA